MAMQLFSGLSKSSWKEMHRRQQNQEQEQQKPHFSHQMTHLKKDLMQEHQATSLYPLNGCFYLQQPSSIGSFPSMKDSSPSSLTPASQMQHSPLRYPLMGMTSLVQMKASSS